MLRLITAATEMPIAIEDAKAQLRVEHDLDDEYITSLIWSAVDLIEKDTGHSYAEEVYELVLDCFPAKRIMIPKPPTAEIVSIKYRDSQDTERTLATTECYPMYSTLEPSYVQAKTLWPSTALRPDAVVIRFRTDDSHQDPTFVQLVKIWVTILYEKREGNISNQEQFTITNMTNKLRDWS